MPSSWERPRALRVHRRDLKSLSSSSAIRRQHRVLPVLRACRSGGGDVRRRLRTTPGWAVGTWAAEIQAGPPPFWATCSSTRFDPHRSRPQLGKKKKKKKTKKKKNGPAGRKPNERRLPKASTQMRPCASFALPGLEVSWPSCGPETVSDAICRWEAFHNRPMHVSSWPGPHPGSQRAEPGFFAPCSEDDLKTPGCFRNLEALRPHSRIGARFLEMSPGEGKVSPGPEVRPSARPGARERAGA